MREETERPDETVLRRLREADTGNDTRNLRSYVVGGVEASQLDYEDWVRPLKLTGGKVCLRANDPALSEPYWVQWRPEGLAVACQHTEWGDDLRNVDAVRVWVRDSDVTLTPVPVEATPFAEADP